MMEVKESRVNDAATAKVEAQAQSADLRSLSSAMGGMAGESGGTGDLPNLAEASIGSREIAQPERTTAAAQSEIMQALKS